MIQKGLLVVFISFLCGYGHAQTYVLDATDNSAIEDVRVSFGENEVIVYTNPQGMLDTTTSECFNLFHPAYYLKIACKTDTVYLHKKTQLLKEVVVTNKTICEWAVPKGREAPISIGMRAGDMLGVELLGSAYQGYRIGHVRFKIKKGSSKDLRLRFHLVNPTDTGKAMVNPIASIEKTFKVGRKRGWVDFDLSSEFLTLPDSKVVLMVEIIGDAEGLVLTMASFEASYESYYLREGVVFQSTKIWIKEFNELVPEHKLPYMAPAIMVEVCK